MQKVYHTYVVSFLLSKKLWVFAIGTIAITSTILCTNSLPTGTIEEKLKIYFLNVDQGDSILIVAPNGNSILVDGGQMNNRARDALGRIKKVSENSIDVILGTHGDADHIGGLVQVMSTYISSLYIETGYKSDTDVYRMLENTIREKNIKKIFLYKKSKIILDQNAGVEISVLHPSFEFVESLHTTCKLKKKKNKNCDSTYEVDTNDMSLVLLVKYKNKKVLLTGDASKEVEKFILKENDLHADVLKLGHHGSKTSSDESFLKEVGPTYSIVSAGKKNRYGHPHNSVVESVKKNTQSKIFETKNVQAYILFEISDVGVTVVEK